jgi:hypothetical protein
MLGLIVSFGHGTGLIQIPGSIQFFISLKLFNLFMRMKRSFILPAFLMLLTAVLTISMTSKKVNEKGELPYSTWDSFQEMVRSTVNFIKPIPGC